MYFKVYSIDLKAVLDSSEHKLYYLIALTVIRCVGLRIIDMNNKSVFVFRLWHVLCTVFTVSCNEFVHEGS